MTSIAWTLAASGADTAPAAAARGRTSATTDDPVPGRLVCVDG